MQGQQRLHVLAYKSKGELRHLLSLRFTSKTTYCHLIAFFLFSVFHSILSKINWIAHCFNLKVFFEVFKKNNLICTRKASGINTLLSVDKTAWQLPYRYYYWTSRPVFFLPRVIALASGLLLMAIICTVNHLFYFFASGQWRTYHNLQYDPLHTEI